MPTLTITKNYADDTVLTEAQLDSAFGSVTTFLNTTGIDDDNIQAGGVGTTSIADDAVTNVKIADDSVNMLQIQDEVRRTPGYIQNIGLAAAQTSVAADSIRVQGADGTALSTSNPGYVVLPDTSNPGQITVFEVTSNVTLDLTGAHCGLGGRGDYSDVLFAVIAINDAGTLTWGARLYTNETTALDSKDSTTQASVTTSTSILVNNSLSGDSRCHNVGWFKANFDDTGGSSEYLWTVQTGYDDIGMGSIEDWTVVCQYTSDNGQSLPNNTTTDLIYEDRERDHYSFYNTSTGVATLPFTGLYRVVATTRFSGATAANRAYMRIRDGGGSTVAVGTMTGVVSSDNVQNVIGEFEGAAGDTIKISIFQNTGSSVSLSNTSNDNRLSIACKIQ